MSSPLGQAIKVELKENFLLAWRTFWKSTLVLTAVFFVVFVGYLASAGSGSDLKNPLFLLILLAYCAIPAAIIGDIISFIRLAWHIAGWWIIVILLLVPVMIMLVFWILGGVLAGEAETIKSALATKAAATDWLDVGPAARVGPIVLLIILPVIAIKALGVLFSPSVLGALAVYILTVFVGLFISFLPSLTLTFIIFTVRIGKRVKQRYTAMSKV